MVRVREQPKKLTGSERVGLLALFLLILVVLLSSSELIGFQSHAADHPLQHTPPAQPLSINAKNALPGTQVGSYPIVKLLPPKSRHTPA